MHLFHLLEGKGSIGPILGNVPVKALHGYGVYVGWAMCVKVGLGPPSRETWGTDTHWWDSCHSQSNGQARLHMQGSLGVREGRAVFCCTFLPLLHMAVLKVVHTLSPCPPASLSREVAGGVMSP